MKLAGILFGLLLLCAAGGIFLIVEPGPDGVVASLELPDGSQCMVTQRCNWSAEPYTVAFYFRPPGGQWGWCYIDHQSRRWHDGRLSWDAARDVVNLTEGGVWRAALDRRRGQFAIGEGAPDREVQAPQRLADPGFRMP